MSEVTPPPTASASHISHVGRPECAIADHGRTRQSSFSYVRPPTSSVCSILCPSPRCARFAVCTPSSAWLADSLRPRTARSCTQTCVVVATSDAITPLQSRARRARFERDRRAARAKGAHVELVARCDAGGVDFRLMSSRRPSSFPSSRAGFAATRWDAERTLLARGVREGRDPAIERCRR